MKKFQTFSDAFSPIPTAMHGDHKQGYYASAFSIVYMTHTLHGPVACVRRRRLPVLAMSPMVRYSHIITSNYVCSPRAAANTDTICICRSGAEAADIMTARRTMNSTKTNPCAAVLSDQLDHVALKTDF